MIYRWIHERGCVGCGVRQVTRVTPVTATATATDMRIHTSTHAHTQTTNRLLLSGRHSHHPLLPSPAPVAHHTSAYASIREDVSRICGCCECCGERCECCGEWCAWCGECGLPVACPAHHFGYMCLCDKAMLVAYLKSLLHLKNK
jgi:hypothetical protein